MTMWILAASSFLVYVFPSVSNGLSIDEMIVGAAESPTDFDFMDLNSGVIQTELDMMLLKEQYDAIYNHNGNRQKRKAIKHEGYRWPNNVIPYHISDDVFSTRDKMEIKKAMDEWRAYTCIDFRKKRSEDKNWVNFIDANGCYSYVGKTRGSQSLGLARGCRHKGIIVHEIGHAVGFHHEQNRPDRDDYVRIMTQNIPPKVFYNFKKYPWSAVDSYGVPYDYTSVMHYGGRAFSMNGEYTIRTVDPKHQGTIGNREGLSFYDVKLANIMYKCCTDKSKRCTERDSFLGKDCKCWCRSDTGPARECGSTHVTDKPGVSTTQVPATTTQKTTCSDTNKNCPAWAEAPQNYCETNDYVRSYCLKSCDACGVDPHEPTCHDKNTHCQAWKNSGFCTGRHEVVMTQHCPKSCNRCTTVGDVAVESSSLMKYPSTFLTMFLATWLMAVFL